MHEPVLLQIPLHDQPFASQNVYVSGRVVTHPGDEDVPAAANFVMGNDTSGGNAWQGADEPRGKLDGSRRWARGAAAAERVTMSIAKG